MKAGLVIILRLEHTAKRWVRKLGSLLGISVLLVVVYGDVVNLFLMQVVFTSFCIVRSLRDNIVQLGLDPPLLLCSAIHALRVLLLPGQFDLVQSERMYNFNWIYPLLMDSWFFGSGVGPLALSAQAFTKLEIRANGRFTISFTAGKGIPGLVETIGQLDTLVGKLNN